MDKKSKFPIVVAGLLLVPCALLAAAGVAWHQAGKRAAATRPLEEPILGEGEGRPSNRAPAWEAQPPRTTVAFAEREPAAATPPEKAPDKPVEKSPEEVVRALDDAFARDVADEAAASNTRTGIAAAFKDARFAGASLREVDCRKTRCRLAVDLNDEDADNRVFSSIFEVLGSSGVDVEGLGVIVPTRTARPDGTVAAVVHLYRGEAPY
jgi:hypothetical protein